MSTPILTLKEYTRNDEDLRQYGAKLDLTADMAAIDAFAGAVTASFCTKFAVSGAISDRLGGIDGGVVGSAYSRFDRVITEVIAYAVTSGSGGVTTIDILSQPYGAGSSFASVFSGSANANKVVLSASLGAFGIASGSIWASGSVQPVWRTGTVLQAKALTAAGATGLSGQDGVTVEVFWKPSGSYGI